MTFPDETPRSSLPPVQYKGEPLEASRGPGLGCFWLQIVALAVLVVLTPASVYAGWPDWASALLLFATIGILLFAGQTIIFLLRLVAAERRAGRRRPMATARSRTIGELEDAEAERGDAEAQRGNPEPEREDANTSPPDGPVRE